MFNNDVTKTYTQQDATWEIIIMLAGAFILGYILSKLLNLLNRKKRNERTYSKQQEAKQESSFSQSNGGRKAKAISGQTTSTYNTPRIDDLTKISGINTEVQSTLKVQGIKSYTDLRDAKSYSLKHVLNSSNLQNINRKEVETWPHQASLAAKGEWKKLTEYQAFIQRSQGASRKVSKKEADKSDDLILIEGIGPKIEEILNNNDIHTFKDVRKTDSHTLKKYIVDADKRFENNETESWPHQAGMAEQNQWEELRIYQEFMVTDNIESSATSNDASEEDDDSTSHLKDHDDLKNIEGIGPKIEEVLNSGGIYTYSQLYNSTRDRLKTLLDGAGKQFGMHEPQSWPHQAGMAHRGEWDQLKVYQEFMDGGREIPSAQASEQLDSSPSEADSDEKDDLQKIEGIGPKIEELLSKAGIISYRNLKDSSVSAIKKLLNDAGPQYRLHEPESWPKQAGMALEGKWEKLDKFQEKLVNERQ